ncbi:MAG: hypothetical protein EZS28_019560 [Streblomastix strix]|uniref:GBD/FH3 domain-containing protein n=1 Tax=Streblomastix strix TaxID=222440 RepID=A0A5J4VRH4_9EUKA|nr:MAG: hypothetical protein EZS28_019560 [Streblomastix strix]
MFTIDDMEILGECILCYKALMNNYLGLQNVVSYPGTIRCLIQTLQIPPNLKKVNIEKGEGGNIQSLYYENSSVVLELIAALCIVPQHIVQDGLKYVMEAAESYRYQMRERVVFEMVLIQLRNRSAPELFLCRILQLINTIIVKHDFLSQRLKLREDWDENIQLNTMIQMLSGKDIGFEERERLRSIQEQKQNKFETPVEQLNKHAWIYIDEMQYDNEESGMIGRNSSEFNPENIFQFLIERFKGTKALFHLNNIGVSLQQLKPEAGEWLIIDHYIERTVNSAKFKNANDQFNLNLKPNSVHPTPPSTLRGSKIDLMRFKIPQHKTLKSVLDYDTNTTQQTISPSPLKDQLNQHSKQS